MVLEFLQRGRLHNLLGTVFQCRVTHRVHTCVSMPQSSFSPLHCALAGQNYWLIGPPARTAFFKTLLLFLWPAESNSLRTFLWLCWPPPSVPAKIESLLLCLKQWCMYYSIFSLCYCLFFSISINLPFGLKSQDQKVLRMSLLSSQLILYYFSQCCQMEEYFFLQIGAGEM